MVREFSRQQDCVRHSSRARIRPASCGDGHYFGTCPTGSLSGEAEDHDRGIAAANFRSDQVVNPYEAGDDLYVLHNASNVGDAHSTGRATHTHPSLNLFGSYV